MNIDDLDQCERCGEPTSWHPRPIRYPPPFGWWALRWLLGFHPYQAAHVVRIPRRPWTPEEWNERGGVVPLPPGLYPTIKIYRREIPSHDPNDMEVLT